MTTTRHGTGAPARHRFLNLPLMLTVGAMILLGITTTTLGFLLWPEPRQWPETVKTTGQTTEMPAGQQPGTDAAAGPDAQDPAGGATRPR
jgi:hypothetical protein